MSLNKLVAIHQPNFFPWLGYFDKINRSDIFVFMDDVAYPKSGSGLGTWTNRVKFLIQGKAVWVGCSVIREHGVQIIKDIYINYQRDWPGKMLKTIRYNYSRAPYFSETMEWLEPLVMEKTEYLSEYNSRNILAICKLLGINSHFIWQSELNTTFASTDLLIEIVLKAGGSSYLFGAGAADYQQDDKFVAAGISLISQDFRHPEYKQVGSREFISGLSIIDAFMYCGIVETKNLFARHQNFVT